MKSLPLNDPPNRRPTDSSHLSWRYPLLACFFLTLLLATHLINDADLGLHLKGGQWILGNHSFPSNDTYTFTIPTHTYLDIHWLYQIILYLLYWTGGYLLVALFHPSLIAATGYLTFKRLRLTGASLETTALLLTVALLACEIRFRARPEVASWLLMSLTLWILESRARRGRDYLFLLPLLQLFWVNIEGLFILGWGLMGIYCLPGFFDASKTDKKLWRYSLLAVAACLLNPYFLRGVAFPFENLATLSNPVMHNSLKELQSPWLTTAHFFSAPTSYLSAYKLFSFFFFTSMIMTWRQRKLQDWLVALSFFGLSASAVRNIPLFLIACLPMAATCWMDLPSAWPRKLQDRFLSNPLAAWAFTLLLIILGLWVLTGAYYLSDRRTDRFGLGLDLQTLPVRACEFLRQNHLDGKILNQFDDGGWLEWRGPQKIFIDPRLEVVGPEFYAEYLSSMDSGGLPPLVLKYDVDILFFNTLNASWTSQLQKMPEWRSVYLDETTAIYLRKGYRDDIPVLDSSQILAQNGVSTAVLAQKPALLGAIPPASWEIFWKDLVTPVAFPNPLSNLGIYYGNSGHPAEAELFFLEAIRRTGGRYYDFYYNLGLLYAYANRREDALACMRRVLRDKPDDPIARQLTGTVPP